MSHQSDLAEAECELNREHTPDPNGICTNCGWQVTSLKADLDDLIPMPGDPLIEAQLDLLHPGSRVADVDHDIWFKGTDGNWKWRAATVSSATLHNIFGPTSLYESSI